MQIEKNPHLIAAYKDYIEARKCVQQGLMGNCESYRARLRAIYRLLAGKPV